MGFAIANSESLQTGMSFFFFFIRPYSSRGIGIWSYVTELHIKRAKRVVKKAECFFQIENLRSLFNLWLTDIFLKGFMMQQTAIRLSSHYIAACRQLFFCFWMVNLNAYTNTCLVQKIVWNTQWGCIFFYTYMYTKIVSYCLICLIRQADLHRCVRMCVL